MHLPGRLFEDSPHVLPRQESGGGNSPAIPIIAGVIGGIAFLAIAFTAWRSFIQPYLAHKKNPNAQERGKGFRHFFRHRYEAASSDEHGDQSHPLSSTHSGQNRSRDVEQATATQDNGAVDRHTSVRSVMTLPAYSRKAAHTEQVLGREGERDGVDIVVELPTENDEEELRDAEMEALYQLRQTRRAQRAERDERRRERQEARDRNDSSALTEIRRRERAASNSNTTAVEELRRDIDQARENRNRSVSSVSYADLGVARHDGTRIRANSQESERMGLLSNAADMGTPSLRDGANSPQPSFMDRRQSSVTSFDIDLPSPAFGRPRSGSQVINPSRLSQVMGGNGEVSGEADLGSGTIAPPEYEDVPLDEASRSVTPNYEPPPDYSGPYRTHSQRSRISQHERAASRDEEEDRVDDEATTARGRGVGGIPQLPSLRISRLPEIVIEPTSAHPRDYEGEGLHIQQRRD